MNKSFNSYADNNFDQVNGKEHSSEHLKSWYAVYTIVRHEKKVQTVLNSRDIESFLPLRDFVSQWKDRKKRVQIPIFPGYLFVNISMDNSRGLLHIYNTRGVIRILGNNGQHMPIPIEQINSIKKLQDCGLNYDLYPYLSEGKKVVVTRGPMEGVMGKVVKRKGKDRLIVSVDLIKRSVGIEVEAGLVELV
ncbi:MAG: transcription termination/antitermination protein NusG [Thermodesulfobacteriota bacterium]